MDEKRLVRRLKEMYSEVEVDTDAPNPKRVKFSDIQDELQKCFPTGNTSTFAISRAITSAFPNSLGKKTGKARQKYIYGVESQLLPSSNTPPELSSASHQSSSASHQSSSASHQSSSTSHESSSASHESSALLALEKAKNLDLQQEIKQLQARVSELEKAGCLVQQMDTLIQCGKHISHGPHTPECFDSFSMGEVLSEIEMHAPDVMNLLRVLGNTDRNVGSDDELKAVTSLCTLLKARSQRVKGMQLLMSYMLIARATSKQVS